MELNHFNKNGDAMMVDVSDKSPMRRTAVATAMISMHPETVKIVLQGVMKKGDVLACARIAGIMAAKKTPELIPLCHNLTLDHVSVYLEAGTDHIDVRAIASCIGRTGVEMEVLTAASIAALTVYDMCKAVDKTMVIKEIKLIKKEKRVV